jgi:hypothetical protein
MRSHSRELIPQPRVQWISLEARDRVVYGFRIITLALIHQPLVPSNVVT